MSAIEQQRLRVNAPRYTASELASLLGRDLSTVCKWAKRNGVGFKGREFVAPRKPVNTNRMMYLSSRLAFLRTQVAA